MVNLWADYATSFLLREMRTDERTLLQCQTAKSYQILFMFA